MRRGRKLNYRGTVLVTPRFTLAPFLNSLSDSKSGLWLQHEFHTTKKKQAPIPSLGPWNPQTNVEFLHVSPFEMTNPRNRPWNRIQEWLMKQVIFERKNPESPPFSRSHKISTSNEKHPITLYILQDIKLMVALPKLNKAFHWKWIYNSKYPSSWHAASAASPTDCDLKRTS